MCAHTDGMAALKCIEKIFNNSKQPNRILVLGAGGVGKAIISFLHDQLIEKNNIELLISARNKDNTFYQN